MWLKDMTFLMTAILMTSLQGNESLKNLGLGRFTLRNECSIWAPKGMLAAGSEIFSHIACLSDPTKEELAVPKHCHVWTLRTLISDHPRGWKRPTLRWYH